MPIARLRGVKKSFTSQPVLRGIDLDVENDEILAILGPSGCGKTTLLRSIAGLEVEDDGTIEAGSPLGPVTAGGRLVPRRIGFLFQDLALWPHLRTLDHLTFVQGASRTPEERLTRARSVLERVGLAGKERRHPHALSGGERQRLALARALVDEPALLLLDEPLSSLDVRTSREMRALLLEIHRERSLPMVYVTHSQAEAFELGQRVVVMCDGRIEQIDTPEAVALRPSTRFVAEFVGTSALVSGRRDGNRFECALGIFDVPSAIPGGALTMVARTADLSITPNGGIEAVALDGRFDGERTVVRCDVGGTIVSAVAPSNVTSGTRIRIAHSGRPWFVPAAESKP